MHGEKETKDSASKPQAAVEPLTLDKQTMKDLDQPQSQADRVKGGRGGECTGVLSGC